MKERALKKRGWECLTFKDQLCWHTGILKHNGYTVATIVMTSFNSTRFDDIAKALNQYYETHQHPLESNENFRKRMKT